MRGTVFSRLRLGATKLLRDQRGNAFMLTAAAIVPVIGIVGSAVDIGRAYMTQLRLQQACDAGVLAGRRAMGGTAYSDTSKLEASKMFSFNFPAGRYGSESVAFTSWAAGASDVTGRATANLPTALMYIFGKDRFALAADCTAKLEISNVDVMMVLDVTGSMASKAESSDADTKIVALRKASIDFFDTLTNADVGDGRLRFGVVPYSSSVNVGHILYAKNPDWLDDVTSLPSRTPYYRTEYRNPETVPSTEYTDSATTLDASWTSNGTVTAKDENACNALTPPVNTTASPSGSPNYNQTGQYEDGSKRVTTYNTTQLYTYRTYRYRWASKKCQKEYKNAKFTRTYVSTTTETKVEVFEKYLYQDRDIDTRKAKAGQPDEADTGTSGTGVSLAWQGCIIERKTEEFAANETAPADAFDMDIDMVPTNFGENPQDTKWKLFLPAVAYPRSSPTPYFGTSSSTSSFAQMGGDTAACPVAAMNLTTMTKTDKNTFSTYINSLQPKGFTYHDAGMAWGARLISPTGLFADENGPYNGRPISRHIVFMTDGDMRTPPTNLSHQGNENSLPRIGATGSTATAKENNAIARHNNRFVQLCRFARQRGVTVWVISFGVGANTNLNTCASSGQAFEAENAAQLNQQFQSIARQISKLRLAQ